MTRRVGRWRLALLALGVFALNSCGGSTKPPVATDAWITGFAEPCVGSVVIHTGGIELDIIATHGTRRVTSVWIENHGTNSVAHDSVVADASNRWRPNFRIRVSPGVYRLTSFDGGMNAPLFVVTGVVTVGANGATQDLPADCK